MCTRVNALPTTRATHRALIRPRLWPYSFAKCHARVGKIERTTGCQVVFALPFFFSLFLFFLSVAPVTQSSSPLLKRFGKNSNFFLLENRFSNSLFRLIFHYDFNSDNMKRKFRSLRIWRSRTIRETPISKSVVIEKITVPNDTPNRNRRLFSVYISHTKHRPVRGSWSTSIEFEATHDRQPAISAVGANESR